MNVYQVISDDYARGERYFATKREALAEAKAPGMTYCCVVRWTVAVPLNRRGAIHLLNGEGWAGNHEDIYNSEDGTA